MQVVAIHVPYPGGNFPFPTNDHVQENCRNSRLKFGKEPIVFSEDIKL